MTVNEAGAAVMWFVTWNNGAWTHIVVDAADFLTEAVCGRLVPAEATLSTVPSPYDEPICPVCAELVP